MAETLNLNKELITEMLQVIARYDDEANQDMMVNLQYLVAVAGYLAADYPGPATERDEILQHLHGLMKHVADEHAQSKQPAASQAQSAAPDLPKGHSEPTDDPAVGVWKPN